MSYNGSGTYVPPAGQPVTTGTVIQSSTFNTLVTDIGNTFNNVLPRDGQAAMQGQLKLIDGTSAVPGLAFNSEASSGMFRPVAGVLALAASGIEGLRLNGSGRVMIGTTTDDGTNKLQVNGAAKISGAATLASTLNVSGATSLSSLATSGATTIGTTLGVTGATSLSTLSTSGAATVGGALTVTVPDGGARTTLGKFTHTGQRSLTVIGQGANTDLGTNSGILIDPAGGSLGIGASGSTAKLILDPNGNLLINKTGLQYALAGRRSLEINGDTSVMIAGTVANAPAGYLYSDLNGTELYGDKRLDFSVAGTQRMRIAADGKVGIGQQNPKSLLDLNSGANGGLTLDHFYSFGANNWALKLDGQDNTSSGYLSQYVVNGGFQMAQGGYYYGSGSWTTDANSTSFASVGGVDGGLIFHTNSGLTANATFTPSERMRIDSSGNVGVGTSTPGAKLDVALPSGSGTPRVRIDQNLDDPYVEFQRWSGTAQNYLGSRIKQRGTDLTFEVQNAGGGAVVGAQSFVERMRLDYNGNLSVGVAGNIQGKATIKGTIATLSPDESTVGQFAAGNDGTVNVAAYRNTGANLILSTSPAGSGVTERMRIDSTGQLMVNTATARGQVTINSANNVLGPGLSVTGKSNLNVAADIEINRAGTAVSVGQGCSLQFNDSVTATNSRLIQAGAGNMQFFGYGTGGWAEHMRIDSSGNLLVGATGATTAKLFVNGRAEVAGPFMASGIAPTHIQGAWLEWNKDTVSGMTYLLNQKGGGSGGIVFGEVDTSNNVTERMRVDGSGKLLIGRTTADATGAKFQVVGGGSIDGYSILTTNAPTINKPTFKGYIEQFQALNPGATITLNPDNGTLIELNVTTNTTVTLPAAAAGTCYTVIAYYSGAYSLTFAGGSTLKWAGGTAPAATSATGKFDKYVFTCGTSYTLGQDGGRNF